MALPATIQSFLFYCQNQFMKFSPKEGQSVHHLFKLKKCGFLHVCMLVWLFVCFFLFVFKAHACISSDVSK